MPRPLSQCSDGLLSCFLSTFHPQQSLTSAGQRSTWTTLKVSRPAWPIQVVVPIPSRARERGVDSPKGRGLSLEPRCLQSQPGLDPHKLTSPLPSFQLHPCFFTWPLTPAAPLCQISTFTQCGDACIPRPAGAKGPCPGEPSVSVWCPCVSALSKPPDSGRCQPAKGD